VTGYKDWKPREKVKAYLAGVYVFRSLFLKIKGAPIIRTGLFSTRAKARDAAKESRLKGKAVKVLVTIEELP